MQKPYLLLFVILPLMLTAADKPTCRGCAVGKELLRCSYYVERKGDISKQDACITYAQSLIEGESPGRASWYFIVGGDFKKAIDTAKAALARGEYFAYEHLGEAWLLLGDREKAKAAFANLRQKVPGYEAFTPKHFQTLQKLYPKRWDSQKAKALF
jgi:hypothetical protein